MADRFLKKVVITGGAGFIGSHIAEELLKRKVAIASVPTSIDNPLASHAVNLTGTLNVPLAARDNHVKKIGVFNIGRGESITLNALAALIISFANSNVVCWTHL